MKIRFYGNTPIVVPRTETGLMPEGTFNIERNKAAQDHEQRKASLESDASYRDPMDPTDAKRTSENWSKFVAAKIRINDAVRRFQSRRKQRQEARRCISAPLDYYEEGEDV